jgi:PhzF family phenazine biosynthesis protein
MSEVLRMAAFTEDPSGGNPAGVVLDATGLDDATMQAIATDVGFSESAFLFPRGDGRFDVRYFSPTAEVAFCGHATVAAGVVLGDGEYDLRIASGEHVPVTVRDGMATLVSVPPVIEEVTGDDLATALRLLGWTEGELDPALPPRIAFAGVRHLVLAAASRERLASLDYDFDGLRELMLRLDLTTVQLIWRRDETTFHARDPFPIAGVVEDPATGAAAAALGGYLRELDLIQVPARITVHQGEDMGRPSRLDVEIPADRPHISVSGHAVVLPG